MLVEPRILIETAVLPEENSGTARGEMRREEMLRSMIRGSVRYLLLGGLVVWCASGEAGRVAISEVGRILTFGERPSAIYRNSSSGIASELPRAARSALEATESGGIPAQRIAALELRRLAILQELPDDAEAAALELTDATREFVANHADEPGAMALHIDALRALRFLYAQVRSPDPALDHELAEMVLAERDRDPENGHAALLLAERAIEAGRFLEARDALLEAARSPRIDPELRTRCKVVKDELRRLGYSRSHIDEMLFLGGYGVVQMRPGQRLDALARELGRRGAEALTEDDAAWVECWAAIASLGLGLARSAVVLEDAVEAMRAEHAYLDEVAEVVPRVVPRDPAARRHQLESKMRALGFETGHDELRGAGFSTQEYVGKALGQIDRSNRQIERTRRIDDVAAAQAILLAWAVIFAAILAFARLIEWRSRGSAEVKDSPELLPMFCRGFGFVVTLGLAVFAVGAGLPPFHQGAGVDRVLAGLAEPNPVFLGLPMIAVLALLGTSVLVPRCRDRIVLSAGAARYALAGVTVCLILFAVTSRSVEDLREKRDRAISALRVEPFWEWFTASRGTSRS